MSTINVVIFIVLLVVLVLLYIRGCNFNGSEGFLSSFFRPKCPSASKESMKLWQDHIALTREYMVRYLDEIEGVDEVANKLMKNQEDIGDFLDRCAQGVGPAATKLLKEHIMGAVDILKLAKKGQNIHKAVDAWYKNAEEISRALSPPLNLEESVLKKMMYEHLRTTLDEVTEHLKRDRDAEINAYIAVARHAREMALYLIHNVPCRCSHIGQ